MPQSIQYIIGLTADVLKIPKEQLLSTSRKKHLVFARHAIMYLYYKHYPPFKPTALAPYLKRDRSTLWHSLGTAKDLMAFNDEFKILVSKIEKFL